MTVQEQNFEQFVNNRQAERDIISDINEWERLKALEEEAIQLWQELDGNLGEYQRQMRTRDQQAMEHQCQRKKDKALHLAQQPENTRAYEQASLNAVARRRISQEADQDMTTVLARRRAFKEAVSGAIKVAERRAKEAAERRFVMEVQQRKAREDKERRAAMEAKQRKARKIAAFQETIKRNMAEFEALKAAKVAAATKAQKKPSEVGSATDGIRSDLGADLEYGGECSHSPSPQHSGSADSVSRDLGSPSLPTEQPIDNTVRPPPNSPRQQPTLTQPSHNPSNSPSPPRATSVDDSTPPTSQHPSRSETHRSSPPETVSRFVPDPAIWGTSNLAPSRNQPSQPLIFERIARTTSMRRRIAFMRNLRVQPVPTSNMNGLMLGEQSERAVPTHGPIRTVERQERPVEDTFVEIIMKGPPGA